MTQSHLNDVCFNRSCCNEIICNQLFAWVTASRSRNKRLLFRFMSSIRRRVSSASRFAAVWEELREKETARKRNNALGKILPRWKGPSFQRIAYCIASRLESAHTLSIFFLGMVGVYSTLETFVLSRYRNGRYIGIIMPSDCMAKFKVS